MMFLENFLIARKGFQFSLAESFEISLKKYFFKNIHKNQQPKFDDSVSKKVLSPGLGSKKG